LKTIRDEQLEKQRIMSEGENGKEPSAGLVRESSGAGETLLIKRKVRNGGSGRRVIGEDSGEFDESLANKEAGEEEIFGDDEDDLAVEEDHEEDDDELDDENFRGGAKRRGKARAKASGGRGFQGGMRGRGRR
jgi:hypothetical protein